MGVRGYIELALVVLILVLIIVALWFWRLKDDSAKDLLAAQAVHAADVTTHKQDVDTIKRITAFRSADDAIISDFADRQKKIDAEFAAMSANISNLRRTNADVEKYLATPIPPVLRDLLNGLPNAASQPAGQH